MQKQYSYIIADPCLKKSITVDINNCPSVQDLKHLIASAIDQDENQFTITNAVPEQQLSLIDNEYEFQISFANCNQDINFILPDGNEIKIIKSNDMNFYEIFKYIQKENLYYYSNECIENMELYVWGIPIPKEGKHLSQIPNNVNVNVQNQVGTITLVYDHKTFILSNYEDFVSVKEFIEGVLGPNVDVEIQCFPDNEFLQNDNVLVNTKKYEINATTKFIFKSIDGSFVIDHKMDYLSTILSAKQLLAFCYDQKINLDNISIFYFDEKITDDSIRLNIINQIGSINFFIKKDSNPNEPIWIKFIFENNDKYNTFFASFERELTINEISLFIAHKFLIEDNIILMYDSQNSKIEIDGSLTLANIYHLFGQIDYCGDFNYILYIKIIKENSQPMIHLNEINDTSRNNCDTGLVRIIETETDENEQQHDNESNESENSINNNSNEQQHDNENSINNSSESISIENNNYEQFLNSNLVINNLNKDLILKLQPQLIYENIQGRGGSSEVYKVTHISDNYVFDINETEKNYALKVFRNNYLLRSTNDCTECDENSFINKARKIMQEYEILSQINHPNIIKSLGYYPGDAQYSPCILFEYAPINLEQLIKKENQSITLENVDLIVIIYEICKAMDCIHKLNIIHRDLKPSNILITSDKHVKLCDLGIAAIDASDTISHTVEIGTFKYMAPEIVYCDSHYNEKVDIWPFGLVLHFILSGGKLPNNYFQNSIIFSPKINNVAKNLILKCLSSNPSERPSFEEILDYIGENQFKLIDGIDDDDLIIIYDRLGFFD